MNNYFLYYNCKITIINQNKEDLFMETYRYFFTKISIYKVNKTKVPAFIIRLIFFGYGIELCTHERK